MRAIIVEFVKFQGDETETFVTRLNAREMNTLTNLGLNLHELIMNEKHEFITNFGEQYRVTLCKQGTIIPKPGTIGSA